MEYLISETEITRRKKAYITFSISLFVGSIIGSLIFKISIPFTGYMLIATILLLIGIFSFRFFCKISQIEIGLSNQLLKRTTGHFTEEYLLTEFKRVEIKLTTNNTIREIYLWLYNGKSIFFFGNLLTSTNLIGPTGCYIVGSPRVNSIFGTFTGIIHNNSTYSDPISY